MRQSSFESALADRVEQPSALALPNGRRERKDRVGAFLVALTAFITYYQGSNPPSGVNNDSAWFDVLMRGFVGGWQWGSDIVFTYGPLGFLTPYFTWNPEISSTFRVGLILLCGLWALMMYSFARRLGALRQVLVIVSFVAWYPLLVMDVGWNVPFVFSIVLIHRLAIDAPLGQSRRLALFSMIALLGLLALVKFTSQVMWFGVVGYATLLALWQRDYRLATVFGIGAPLLLLGIWISVGQRVGGFGDYISSSLEMSTGYGAMSLQPAPYVDVIGLVALALLVLIIALGFWLSAFRAMAGLTAVALVVLVFFAWKAGFVRPDEHVAIFFGTASFIALASMCPPALNRSGLATTRWVAVSAFWILCLWASYGFLSFDWSLARLPTALAGLFQPSDFTRSNQAAWGQQVERYKLPRTQARVGGSRIDVLMNEQSIAILNRLNYQPRPVFQGYAAYTANLTRRNEAKLLNPTEAPDFLLTKLQSIDYRLPTGDDPLSVLSALRAYLPVDLEGGYLVMQRTGWPISPISTPERDSWKGATLGADITFNSSPMPQLLFFDVRLNFWGKLRSFFLREPNLRIKLSLNDGTEQSYLLVRKLGPAGMLISPFMLSEIDYLRWHASLAERRVTSMRLVASDQSQSRWFDTTFAYVLAPVDLPRRKVSDLSPELQAALYPGFSPAPESVISGREEVVHEGGKDVLFTHAPATIQFKLAPGNWIARGEFGLLSSAFDCLVSDGIALEVERLSSDGSTTRLFERIINPVHSASERGAQTVAFGPFEIRFGDKVIFHNLPGVKPDARGDCDWMFLGPLKFEKDAGSP